MKPILEIAEQVGVPQDFISPYGKWKGKIRFDYLKEVKRRPGKLILVSAMTPTPFGEGKTVSAIGLAMGLWKIGKRSIVCLRQPSLGPVFGIKGGAAGGGRSTVEPMAEINLGLNGDIYSIGSAHNLLSAMIDNHIFHGNELAIDPTRVTWKRTVDMNDRALRHITVGEQGKKQVPRHDGFVITAASEVMAIFGLAGGYGDLKEKLGRIIIGRNNAGNVIRASDLKAEGAMAAILRDSMDPNIVQTSESTPALVHGGPFGNIAHGTASLNSIRMGVALSEYCVVEAGFATELGAEKFFDIVCRLGGLNVDAAVVVASIRALKHHGGASQESISAPAPVAVKLGLENLEKHIQNIREFGLDPVVALNRFTQDTSEEIKVVEEFCKGVGVPFAVSSVFEEGGSGGVELAERVVESAERGKKSSFLYSLNESIEDKVSKIAKRVYGADGVEYTSEALNKLEEIKNLGLSGLPICVAKTQLSLSDDPHRIGRPRGFSIKVRDVQPSAGAGFNVVYTGEIETMPGLPIHPNAEKIDLLEDGTISGLF